MANVEIRGEAPTTADLRYYDYAYMRSGRLVTHLEPSLAWTIVDDPKPGDLRRAGAAQQLARAPRGPIGVLADRLANIERDVPANSPSAGPAQDVEPGLRRAIDNIIDAWFDASAHQATMRRAAKHPNFRLLRNTGNLAIEQVVERLRRDPNALWVWALGELTGDDPARGTETVSEAAQAWIAWADVRGLG